MDKLKNSCVQMRQMRTYSPLPELPGGERLGRGLGRLGTAWKGLERLGTAWKSWGVLEGLGRSWKVLEGPAMLEGLGQAWKGLAWLGGLFQRAAVSLRLGGLGTRAPFPLSIS